MFALTSFSLFLLNERQIFDIRTLTQIDPLPHTQELIKQKKYADAYEYMSYFMEYDYVSSNPEAQKLYKYIQEVRKSYDYKANKVIEGILKGKSDETLGQLSAIASDFLVIGDIRDLAIQGTNYANDKEVDKVILALSSIGLLTSASTIYSLGATSPIKSSISLLKYGKRAKKLPPWLSKQLVHEAKALRQTKSLTKLEELLKPINKLYDKVGLKQTLDLLKQTKNLGELKTVVKFSSRFGKKSSVLLKITKDEAKVYAKRLPNVTDKNFLYASSYGKEGLKGLQKLGSAKFIKRTRALANLSKTAYKGNLDSLLTYLLKTIPTSLLYATVFLGLFYFIRKFYSIYRGVFS